MKDENGKRREKGNVVVDGRSIDFLGYCFTPTNVRIRKSIKQSFARKAKRITNDKRRREVLASYWGWCKWGHCRNLWNKVTNNDMSFADIGISGRITTKDGQKYFDVKKIKIDTILNLPITVVDFETNISTPHGPGRYAVKIQHNGEDCKFFTNSFTLKSMLDQAKAKNAFPIDTVVKKKDIGGKFPDYYFE
ncbi:MAG: hypothetical protein HDR88_10670 [Bacteroides sp.]|nr:hypothetical protein [Bacteroides sp.]